MNIHPVQAISVGWKKYMERPWYFFGLGLAAMALIIAVSSNSAAYTALAAIACGGFLAMLIKHYDGHKIIFDDLFSLQHDRWISFAFVITIKGFGILLGLLCFIVPGIYLIIRWMFAEYLIVDKGLRPIEALRESSKMTEGVKWALLGYLLLGFLIMLLGLIVLVVGIIPASMVLAFATIHIYRQLLSRTESRVTESHS